MFGRDGLWDHNYGVYPELTHVPLNVWGGENETIDDDTTVGLLDVYRTILDLAGVEGADTRGRNLADDPDSRQYLVERHGLRSSRIEALRNKDYSMEFIDEWDQTLYGVVEADGTYAWETKTGFMSDDEMDMAAARDHIEELHADLDEADVTIGDDRDVPSDVQDRLNKLGYISG